MPTISAVIANDTDKDYEKPKDFAHSPSSVVPTAPYPVGVHQGFARLRGVAPRRL